MTLNSCIAVWLLVLAAVSPVMPILHFNRVLTWNSQGARWDLLAGHLHSTTNPSYDIAVVQEAGRVPRTMTPTQRNVIVQDITTGQSIRETVDHIPLSGAVDVERDNDPDAPELDPRSLDGTRIFRVLQRGTWNNVHEYTWRLGTSHRPDNYYVYHYAAETVGNARISMAIVSRTRARRVYIFVSAVTNNRPIMGILLDEADGYVFNVHAPAFPANLLALAVNNITQQLIGPEETSLSGSSPHHWIFVGDFNRRGGIEHLLENHSEILTQQVIRATGSTHHGGSSLDFMIAGHSTPHLPTLYRGSVTSLSSDHNAVRFDLIDREPSGTK